MNSDIFFFFFSFYPTAAGIGINITTIPLLPLQNKITYSSARLSGPWFYSLRVGRPRYDWFFPSPLVLHPAAAHCVADGLGTDVVKRTRIVSGTVRFSCSCFVYYEKKPNHPCTTSNRFVLLQLNHISYTYTIIQRHIQSIM